MGERKYFELRALARKPRKPHKLLAQTCVVQAEQKGHCFVTFSERFVEWVGKKLPRGIAEFDPAYLAVVQNGEVWEVFAVYVDRSAHALLWESKSKPEWVGKLRTEKPHDGKTTHKGARGCGAATGDGTGSADSRPQAAET